MHRTISTIITRTVIFAIAVVGMNLFLAVPSSHGAGILITEGDGESPLRIQDHLVSVQIRNQIALTTLNQTFFNTSDRRLEGTYIFPIPDGADITNFQMTFNGKMIEGEVLPADEARQIYESIVRRQRDPGLIEFIGRRLLRARIFPIEPHSTTEIQITYQQILDTSTGMTRYRYPLRTPGTQSTAYGTVRFAVDINAQAPLRTCWSPTHKVEIIRSGDHDAKAVFEKSGASLDEDFLLLYDTDEQDVGMSFVAHRDETDLENENGQFMLILSPKDLWDDDLSVPQDYVFVVDTSGSMAGEKIEQVRNSLTYCIDRLEAEDRFSIVRFSTGFDLVFDALQPATNENTALARDAVKKYAARGGTNIFGALEQAVAMHEDGSDRPFVVIFLTDGLGDRSPEDIEDMLSERLQSFKGQTRIFPFGVGDNVNTKLLDGLATNHGGMPTYVQPGENLEYMLGDFFSVFSEPVLTNVKVSLPNAGITDRFPPVVGDMYHGRQLVLAGQFSRETTGTVVLTGQRGSEKVRYVWDNIAFESQEDATYVSRIWAGRKIAYLLSRIRLHGESDEMVAEVTSLATTYGIQTPYTSWLVVPESERGSRDDREIRLGFSGGGGAAPSGAADGFVRENRRRSSSGANNARGGGKGQGVDSDATAFAIAPAEESGEAAVRYSKALMELRDEATLSDAATNLDRQTIRRFNGREFWNYQGVLVDTEFTDTTEKMAIRFGSEAYFDLVMNREDLRDAMAAAKCIVILVADDLAVMVYPDSGLEELTDERKARLW